MYDALVIQKQVHLAAALATTLVLSMWGALHTYTNTNLAARDGEKSAYDKQSRAAMRVLATLTLLLMHDGQLNVAEGLPSAGALLELVYGLLPALSKDITAARRAAVGRRFKSEEETKLLLSKEDVKSLKTCKEQDKLLSGGSYSNSSHRSHARGRPYLQKPYSYSKGKGKGKGKS